MQWLVDCAIINAFILWRKDAEQRVIGRQNEHIRSQRVFREAIIEYLLKETPEPRLRFDFRIRTNHQFIEPNHYRLALYYHQLQTGLPRTRCYMYRIKVLRGELLVEYESRVRTVCLICEVPLCGPCFIQYHQL